MFTNGTAAHRIGIWTDAGYHDRMTFIFWGLFGMGGGLDYTLLFRNTLLLFIGYGVSDSRHICLWLSRVVMFEQIDEGGRSDAYVYVGILSQDSIQVLCFDFVCDVMLALCSLLLSTPYLHKHVTFNNSFRLLDKVDTY
jgi:hypothetical protein